MQHDGAQAAKTTGPETIQQWPDRSGRAGELLAHLRPGWRRAQPKPSVTHFGVN